MDTNKVSLEPHRGFRKSITETNICACPKCGHETFKKLNESCTSIQCPICNSTLINK